MNVLVIGDEHIYGYGLSGGKLSYLGHFIRLIGQAGQEVSLEAYAHLTLPQISSTLAQLPLNRYDLIILQVDHGLFESTRADSLNLASVAMPVLPYSLNLTNQSSRPGFWQRFNTLGTALLSTVWPSYALKGISALLKQLRPFRHNVLLLSPLPHRERISGWLRQRSRTMLLTEADKQLFSVFDSDSVIKPREEYFLPNDHEHLNAISHELLGRELFDFYQSAPTIITIQTIRREQE